MKHIDVTVPLDARLPTYPNNTPFSLEPIKRVSRGDSSNVSTLHMSAHTGTRADLRLVGCDGAPARVVLSRP
jgi:kynurenine formamidase